MSGIELSIDHHRTVEMNKMPAGTIFPSIDELSILFPIFRDGAIIDGIEIITINRNTLFGIRNSELGNLLKPDFGH